MLSLTVDKMENRRESGNNFSYLKFTGEPCAVKVACTVWKGLVGKVSSSLFIKECRGSSYSPPQVHDGCNNRAKKCPAVFLGGA